MPAEISTEERFPSSVCIGDKPKTDAHMLSVLITESAALMCLHYVKKQTVCIWKCRHVVSHLVFSHYPKYTDVGTIQIDACVLDVILTTHVAVLDASTRS